MSHGSCSFSGFVECVVVKFVVEEECLEVRDTGGVVGLPVQLLQLVPVSVEVDPG